MGGQRFVQVLWHECGRQITQHRSQCAVTGICPIRFNACFKYIYTCSRLFMFTLSSHILHSLGRHRCYLSHAFLSHPVLTSLRLRVVFFLPAHPHSLILMYIRLRQLDHVPFLAATKYQYLLTQMSQINYTYFTYWLWFWKIFHKFMSICRWGFSWCIAYYKGLCANCAICEKHNICIVVDFLDC